LILSQLTKKTCEVTKVDEGALEQCRPYLPEGEAADVVHAATCLQSGSVLITNDKDFDKIKDSGIIGVWSTTQAIEMLSIRDGWVR
jgi:predicted nucleic acid-binding protein